LGILPKQSGLTGGTLGQDAQATLPVDCGLTEHYYLKVIVILSEAKNL
jgi:hypothetical protein